MKSGTIFALALITLVAIVDARQHPCLFLNSAEIQAINAKAKSGAQPWKAAMDKTLTAANASLTAGPWHVVNHILDCSSNGMRLEMAQLGYALKNMALAWHYTGDKKYADRAIHLVNVWFFNEATYMKPDHSKGLLGASNSFQHVIYGVDLFWPAFPTEMQQRLTAWFNLYSKSVVKVENGYSGGVTGGSNRSDWGCSMMMMSGIMGENAEGITNGIERYKRRTVRASGELVGVQSAEICGYSFFSINALHNILEAARHNGVDLYSYEIVNGKSRIERIDDYYGRYTYNAALWVKEHGETIDDCGNNEGPQLGYYEIAYAYKEKANYWDIISKVGRPIATDRGAWYCGIFGPATLTHARGAYPFRLYSDNGQVIGMIGGATSTTSALSAFKASAPARTGLHLIAGPTSLFIVAQNPGHKSSLYRLDGRQYQTTRAVSETNDLSRVVSGRSRQ